MKMQVAYAICKILQVLIFFHHKINYEYIFYFFYKKILEQKKNFLISSFAPIFFVYVENFHRLPTWLKSGRYVVIFNIQ